MVCENSVPFLFKTDKEMTHEELFKAIQIGRTFALRPGFVDEYLHRVVCAPKKNRSGSTPYANKRNRKRKNKHNKK